MEATTCSLSPFLPTLESIIRRLFHLLSERRSAGIVALNVHNMTGHGHWTIETGIPRRPMKIRQASKQGTPLPSWYLRGIMSDFVRLKSFKFHHPTSYHQGANRSRVWACTWRGSIRSAILRPRPWRPSISSDSFKSI